MVVSMLTRNMQNIFYSFLQSCNFNYAFLKLTLHLFLLIYLLLLLQIKGVVSEPSGEVEETAKRE